MNSNELLNKTAVLYSLEAPSEEQERRFRNFIATRYGEGYEFRWEKSDAFPGGFRLEVGKEVYDWSVGGRFQQLRDTTFPAVKGYLGQGSHQKRQHHTSHQGDHQILDS